MLSTETRLKIHMLVETSESIEELKVLCRALIERDLAHQQLLAEHGIPSTLGGLIRAVN